METSIPKLHVYLASLLICSQWAVIHGRGLCHDVAVPAFKLRGTNRIVENATEPLFDLTISPRRDYEVTHLFEVRIDTKQEGFSFTDATIIISSQGHDQSLLQGQAEPTLCRKGEFHHKVDDFFQVKQDGVNCPTVLSTNRKTPMSSLPPLTWTPPSCGCVQFKAVLVLEGGEFYLDATSSPLSKRLCIKREKKKISRAQRLDGLCTVTKKHATPDIISGLAFRRRHQLDIRITDSLELEMALELRRADARMCCVKSDQIERQKCFQDSRYRRVDRLCKDGYPDIPFVPSMATFMRTKERQCCSILGTYRYMCFAKGSQLMTGSDVTAMDFSLDATDPVNDFAELGTIEDFKEFLETLEKSSKLTKETWIPQKSQEHEDAKESKTKSQRNVDSDGVMTDNAKDFKRKFDSMPKMALKSSDKTRSPLPSSVKSNKRGEVSIPTPPSSSSTQSSTQETNTKLATRPLTSHITGGVRKLTDGVRSRHTSTNGPERMKNKDKRGRSTSKSSRRRGKKRSRGKSSAEQRRNQRRGFSREEWRDYKRLKSAERKYSFGRTGSERKLGLKRTSAERKLGLRRTSAERQLGLRRTSAERKLGLRRTSAERRSKGRSRATKRNFIEGSVMEDFDADGGQSVEKTLNNLERKMKRLELRRICCQDGALMGREMTESLINVMDECRHGSHKYLQRMEISFGANKCGRQFAKCCVDEATIGLAMTSSEFRNSDFFSYVNNVRTNDDGTDASINNDKTLLTRKGAVRTRGRSHDAQLRAEDMKGVRDTLEAESDRRFNSMRGQAGDPQFVIGRDLDLDEEEYTGPQRFDDVDNKEMVGSENDDVTSSLDEEDEINHASDNGDDSGDISDEEDTIETDDEEEEENEEDEEEENEEEDEEVDEEKENDNEDEKQKKDQEDADEKVETEIEHEVMEGRGLNGGENDDNKDTAQDVKGNITGGEGRVTTEDGMNLDEIQKNKTKDDERESNKYHMDTTEGQSNKSSKSVPVKITGNVQHQRKVTKDDNTYLGNPSNDSISPTTFSTTITEQSEITGRVTKNEKPPEGFPEEERLSMSNTGSTRVKKVVHSHSNVTSPTDDVNQDLVPKADKDTDVHSLTTSPNIRDSENSHHGRTKEPSRIAYTDDTHDFIDATFRRNVSRSRHSLRQPRRHSPRSKEGASPGRLSRPSKEGASSRESFRDSLDSKVGSSLRRRMWRSFQRMSKRLYRSEEKKSRRRRRRKKIAMDSQEMQDDIEQQQQQRLAGALDSKELATQYTSRASIGRKQSKSKRRNTNRQAGGSSKRRRRQRNRLKRGSGRSN